MSNDAWPVQPHQPIDKLTENLWRVEGNLGGTPLRRVMTLARLVDGRVVVHSAVALDEPSMQAIEAWGEPSVLLVPNGFHRLDAPRFVERYPKMTVLCPPAVRARVASVVPVHGDYGAFPADPRVSAELLDGLAEQEGILRVESDDGTTLVFNDVLFNMPHVSGFRGFVLRHVMVSSGGPRVSRLAKLALVKNRRAFGAHLRRLADIERLRRVIVSHHVMITQGPSEVLREIAATMA